MGFILVIIIILVTALALLTPLGFGRLKLEGEYQVKITVNGQDLTATMIDSRPSMAFRNFLNGVRRPSP